MTTIDALRNPEAQLNSSAAGLAELVERLEGSDKVVVQDALQEIRHMQGQLDAAQENFHEMDVFFRNWAESFDSILTAPVNIENHEQLKIRFTALRNSARNLVGSCQRKIGEFIISR